MDLSDPVYVTTELKDEVEVHKAAFPEHRSRLQEIKFADIEEYQYHGGEYFDKAKYLFNYKYLINKYSKITSFYGLKGLGDMSILAAVATIVVRDNPSLFDAQEVIEVVTHDKDLKESLIQEFGTRIIVSDPS